MLPTTPTRGYFGIWIRFFRMIISFGGKLCVRENEANALFFYKYEKLDKSHFRCDGQGHNALFTDWTDVTLFSAIRTHRGHLGHAKHAGKLNT